MTERPTRPPARGHELHSRAARGHVYVYAARSRRVGGISVGINLDPQQTCNFDCVYCEVIDRRALLRHVGRPAIDPEEVARELAKELGRWPVPLPVSSPGAGASAEVDTVRDIAFAGDGEPSTFPGFLPLARRLLDVRDSAGFGSVPLVLITNGSGLGRREMVLAHDLFAERGGEFWIKLDAGTEAFYREVCRTSVPFGRVLANLLAAAKRHPVVVQAMFFSWRGEGPSDAEVEAWAARLAGVAREGGRISLVQVYTVARETMEAGIAPLPAPRLEEIAEAARGAVPGLAAAVFP